MAELFRHTEGAPCCLLVFRYEPQTFSPVWRSASLESSYHNGTCGSFLSACACLRRAWICAPYFVPGLPNVILIELRQALILYQDYHMLSLTFAGEHGFAHLDKCAVRSSV